jgi:glycyl-tRNA synthetase beta chain
MSADFLLELLSEEIPARMQARARGDLARMFAEALTAAGLSHEGITTYSTPRRLVLIARGLPASTEAVSEEVKGPRTSAPPQALEGFLRKTALEQGLLEDRDGIWFARIDRPGRPAADVLADAVAGIVRDFPWPKSMRWGAASGSTASLRWVRPLHSIVALLGEEIVPVAIDGVECGAATLGHRFHHPGPITIGSANDYVEKLRACHVIVDQEEREAIVRDGAVAAAKGAGFELVEDEGLVVENAGLTEWPVPLLGSFDADYLDVPEEVIRLTARINQKYFVMRDGAGKLAPRFVCVANIDAKDGGEAIVAGNERVLAARLSDARFFWEQDLKIPLEEQAKKLSGIVFHEKLGTVADKVERVAKLARWLIEEGIVTPAKAGVQPNKENLGSRFRGNDEKVATPADQAERAARLAKADLVTGMVGEFPELQGVIGGHLARAQGESGAVADAVRDHYKPAGQGDDVPTAALTVAVSLADKLDTICAFFAIDQKPTGSKDPFALRRAAISSIELIVRNGLRLSLTNAVRGSLANRAGQQRDTASSHKLDRTAPEILEFFADRLKVQQREAGVRHDLIDAVFAFGGEDDLVRLLARVKALQAFVETAEGTNLLSGYKRAANILKKEKWDLPRVMASRGDQGIPQTGEEDPLVLVEEPAIAAAVAEMAQGSATPADAPAEEAALVAALDAAESNAEAAVEAEDFTAAMEALAILRAPIDAFFDKVTVNDADGAVRARRLNLLARFRDAVHQVADFSRIEG